MNLQEAKKAVSKWLWESEARTTVNREWDNQYITDAAQMLIEAYCKIEQLEIAHKGIVAENQRLAALRDAKTEALRTDLRESLELIGELFSQSPSTMQRRYALLTKHKIIP